MSDPTAGDESPIKLPASIPDSQAAQQEGGDEAKVKWWLQQISDARSREKDWRRDAMKCVDLYEAVKKKDYQYNVLYTNTELLSPALYNTVPKPVVVRRFRDADPMGKVACDVVKRILSFFADSEEFEFPDFDTLMKQSVLEALVPGRGVVRFKHEVEFCETEVKEGEPPAAAEPAPEAVEEIKYETVVGECVPWDRFTHGYAKQWRKVPWVAFDHFMSREELCQNFGKTLGAKIELNETEKESEEGQPTEDKWSKKRDDQKGVKLALVHEIWNKVDRTVIFLSPGYPLAFIKQVDDPLNLTGFFPMPEPLRLFAKIKTLVPTTLYAQYEEQAKELNRLTLRINRIIGACKARGMYDKRVGGIERLMQQDDNTLLPIEQMAQLGDTAKLDAVIWLYPIDKLVSVLQQLYTARDQIKMVLQEMSGIADVLRGSAKASETLGAQQIKEQWGTLRISRMQRCVQKFAKNCFRMMAEIGVGKLGADTIAKITGLPFPMDAQKKQAQMLVQQWQQLQVQQQMAQPPAPAQPGQPPAPPQQQQPPPQVQQAMQTANQPSWGEILTLLRDTLARSYRIDIETNSTIDPEATDDQEQIANILNAIAQVTNAFLPMVESGAMPPEAVKGILTTVCRRFRFGDELESFLDQITTPQQKPDPKVQAAQAMGQVELQMKRMDQQLQAQKNQQQIQQMQQKAAMEERKHQLEMQKMQMDQEFALAEHQMKMREVEIKSAAVAVQAQAKVQAAHAMPKKPAKEAA